MGLNKRTYTDGSTVITAQNLNEIQDAIIANENGKEDKVEGKGLSKNDFTDELKAKLEGVEAGAEVNVQADWNEADSSKDDYIKNKPQVYTKSEMDTALGSKADKTALINYEDTSDVGKTVGKSIVITDSSTTLGDINTILGSVNTAGDHVDFDVAALGAGMYRCMIFIDTVEGVYKIHDLVKARIAEGAYEATLLLSMAIALASDIATQSQIDALQREINDLGGKTVLEDPEALANLIASGGSQAVISAGDTTEFNWIASVLGTTSNGLTVTCTDIDTFANGIGEAEAATYMFVFDGSNWTYDGEIVDLTDFALTVTGTPQTGEVMTIRTTVTSKSFTFVDYDGIEAADNTVAHNWCLEQTYAPDTKTFDTYESVFCIQAGKSVPAGKYYLPMLSYSSNKTFNICFELAAAIGGVGKVQIKSTGYRQGTFPDRAGTSVASKYVPKTPLKPVEFGTTTSAGADIAFSILSDADAQSGGYTLLTSLNVDPADPVVVAGNFDCATFGDNTWAYSNIRKWLNDDTKDNHFVPAHDNDIASTYNYGAGWLYGLDPRVRAIIQTAKVKCTAGYGNTDDYPQGQTYTVEDDVFLLSMKEMSFDINTSEGSITDLYGEYTNNTLTNSAVAARAKYNKAGGTLNSYRWSRSAYTGNAYVARHVQSDGSHNVSNAFTAYYFAPAFIIGKASS